MKKHIAIKGMQDKQSLWFTFSIIIIIIIISIIIITTAIIIIIIRRLGFRKKRIGGNHLMICR
jgi:uncharacterized Tic20 family protein